MRKELTRISEALAKERDARKIRRFLVTYIAGLEYREYVRTRDDAGICTGAEYECITPQARHRFIQEPILRLFRVCKKCGVFEEEEDG